MLYMGSMHQDYGRNLDLNLLRVFVVVAAARSVTQAAAQLYLTQPAVSAALRRLTEAVGAPLFVRSGRGLALSERGQQLFASAQPLLAALVEATLAAPQFDPLRSERTLRLGISDAMEGWLLPRLLRALDLRAPQLKLLTVPVTFRSVGDALATRSIDLAVTVADALPAAVRRQQLLHSGFVCLFDPRHHPIKGRAIKARISAREYFARDHMIVSYNADLRGIVEDMLHKQRKVRCSVPGFSHIGALIEGSPRLATVPSVVAHWIVRQHPRLRSARLPFALHGTGIELLWPAAADDDPAGQLVRAELLAIGAELARERPA